MNLHGLVDDLGISLGALVMARSKYFRDGVDTAPFSQHVKAVKVTMPVVAGEGHHELAASTLAEELAAAFRVAQWKGERHPTIRGIRTLENVVAMLAVSVVVVERLVALAKEQEATPTLVTGISLGGFVANRHHATYNSADLYVPALAGAAMGDLFLNSTYRKGVAQLARQRPDEVRAALDFQGEYATTDHRNVFPVLARHDRIVVYERQKDCYGDQPILTLDKGHITGALAYGVLRRHILDLVVSQEGPTPRRGK